jgi:hypothetical protein
MRYPSNPSRTTAHGRAPRTAKNHAELKKIYAQYIRMGFDAREARFKAHAHHTSKL